MPSSEYTTAGGGALKLKGQAGIEKKRKKKKHNPHDVHTASASSASKTSSSSLQKALAEEDIHESGIDGAVDEGRLPTAAKDTDQEVVKQTDALHSTKTEAERRYEERRRKRLDERVKREGLKTHKERVEELNRYLSNLSEHHDM